MTQDQANAIYELGVDAGYQRGVADVLASLQQAAAKLREPVLGSVASKETGKVYPRVVLESPRTHLASICDQIADIIKQELHHDNRPSGTAGRTAAPKPN